MSEVNLFDSSLTVKELKEFFCPAPTEDSDSMLINEQTCYAIIKGKLCDAIDALKELFSDLDEICSTIMEEEDCCVLMEDEEDRFTLINVKKKKSKHMRNFIMLLKRQSYKCNKNRERKNQKNIQLKDTALIGIIKKLKEYITLKSNILCSTKICFLKM